MPFIPGTRPGGGKPIKMPPISNDIPGKYLKAKTIEELEYASIAEDDTVATKAWVEENYTIAEILDGGNF